MAQVSCSDGRFEWSVANIVMADRRRLNFQCQPPDVFREEREDGTQGYVKSPWISVQIDFNEAEETARLVFEADHLGDEKQPGRQIWNALVYHRGNETLVINFEARESDVWDGSVWICRVLR